ncbi:MAG TPA: ribosome maturation factor RimM [Spirochaetota bacterium]|jgi:16S rRNA processing protein RimM|nr:MAG: Ribosome maturation factor RimM [Spirochaetes bacterium ADurb.Bin133]HNZ26988.1 ribosome maturation factor RimM [Spirochaetota bacterium]HOF02214.1 ribosome maturation factor RimM [Spirochaetota bacterium]HOS54562.1 ribosome maturation factor RimM [Spirochaetota bacterium]HPK61288.1 ribosome maturation factor RimM [Spirochaetota bacterium]
MDLLKIGFITKPRGLKGELKVFPLTDDVERFKKLDYIIIKKEDGDVRYKVQYSSITPKEAIVKLEGYDRLESVEFLIKNSVYIEKKDGADLKEWEYYTQDLVGCKVFYNDSEIGLVKGVFNAGANDNIVVDFKGDEVYYPFVRHYFDKIDVANKSLVINQYEGFFD